MADPFDLKRFVEAQDEHGTYEGALAELKQGQKRSHWIWYVFPQMVGLGRSHNSTYYGITSLNEAKAYLAHPVLGPRLRECAEVVASTEGRTAQQIFGGLDAGKLRSSMTLFMRAAPEEPVFKRVLDKYFGGEADAATDHLL